MLLIKNNREDYGQVIQGLNGYTSGKDEEPEDCNLKHLIEPLQESRSRKYHLEIIALQETLLKEGNRFSLENYTTSRNDRVIRGGGGTSY